MTDVLTKEQFEREWQERTKLVTTSVTRTRIRVPLRGIDTVPVEPRELLQALARPLLAAALEALLEFDAVDVPVRSRRRIRRK